MAAADKSRESMNNMSRHKKQSVIDFPVPPNLKQSPIYVNSIAIEDDSFVIKHRSPDKIEDKENPHDQIRFQITGNHEEDMTTLRRWAKNNFYFIDNPDFIIDQLVSYVGALYVDGAAKTIAKIIARNEEEARKLEEKKEGKIKKRFIQKYYSSVEGVLYESVLISGQPCFVAIQVDVSTREPFARAYEKIVLPEYSDKPTMELYPRDKESYLSKPYEFSNEQELNDYIKRAMAETLDSLFYKVLAFAGKYIVGSYTHLTMLAADTILTYFQDKLGQVHYLFFYGDNNTGKSTNLVFMDCVAYRAMFDISITPPNIYTYLGTVQEGQGCILEDEADNIDQNEEKQKIYKRGYNSGGKVSRIADQSSSVFGRDQDSYYVYCFKAFTAERRPDGDKAKGFNERNLYIECQSGTPEYDIVEVTSGAAGDPTFRARLEELEDLHKLLFAYRLLHHGDPLPDIKNVSVKNREKQLTKPLLRLFQGTKCRQEIAKALAELIIQRRGIKKDTLDSKIYRVIKHMIGERAVYRFSNTLVFIEVSTELDGKYRNEGDQSFETPDHGKVSHKRITQICLDKFGASKESDGKTRYLVFDKDKLAKAGQEYELADTLELFLTDTSYTFYTSTEDKGVSVHNLGSENYIDPSNNSTNEEQKPKEIDKNGESEGSEYNENTLLPSHNLSNVSDLSATNLEDSSSLESV